MTLTSITREGVTVTYARKSSGPSLDDPGYVKPGYATTEFIAPILMTLFAVVAVFNRELGQHLSNEVPTIASAAAGLVWAGYIAARTVLKVVAHKAVVPQPTPEPMVLTGGGGLPIALPDVNLDDLARAALGVTAGDIAAAGGVDHDFTPSAGSPVGS